MAWKCYRLYWITSTVCSNFKNFFLTSLKLNLSLKFPGILGYTKIYTDSTSDSQSSVEMEIGIRLLCMLMICLKFQLFVLSSIAIIPFKLQLFIVNVYSITMVTGCNYIYYEIFPLKCKGDFVKIRNGNWFYSKRNPNCFFRMNNYDLYMNVFICDARGEYKVSLLSENENVLWKVMIFLKAIIITIFTKNFKINEKIVFHWVIC